MEKLESYQLIPYILHDLKLSWHNGETIDATLTNISHIIQRSIEYPNMEIWKPLLRPWSDINKQISHKGDKFVPIEIIGKKLVENGEFFNGLFGWNVPTGGDDYVDYYINLAIVNNIVMLETWSGEPNESFSYVIDKSVIDYKIFEMLVSWHFDVFGLIEKGFAKPINNEL